MVYNPNEGKNGISRRTFIGAAGVTAALGLGLVASGADLAQAAPASAPTPVRLSSPDQHGADFVGTAAGEVTIFGVPDQVDSSKLLVAGVTTEVKATHKNTIGLQTDHLLAEPGCRMIDYVSIDPTQAKKDVQELNSTGSAVLTSLAIRHLTQETDRVPLFQEGITMFTMGMGTLAVEGPDKTVAMEINLPAVKKRGYIVYIRGIHGGPNDDNNAKVIVTRHNPPYADGYVLPDKSRFASEDQFKQQLENIYGKEPSGTNCGNMNGCNEAVAVLVDATTGAYTIVKQQGKGAKFELVKTNIK